MLLVRCLVTGHEGFIGSELYKELVSLGHDVRGIDLKSGKDVIEVLDPENTSAEFKDWVPDCIFHLACIPRVAYSVEHPLKTARNNILATSVVLAYAKKNKVSRVVYSGSSSVVGNGHGPMSPYAMHKLTSEMECKIYSDLYNLDTVTLRYFNVYSERKDDGNPYATAIAKWRHSIKNNIDPFITGDGNQRRDMAHLLDVVSANIFCMNYENNFNGSVYDVGTGTNISLNEIKQIVSSKDPSINFEYVDPRPGDVFETLANMEPLRKIGWVPCIELKEGVEKCFEEFKI